MINSLEFTEKRTTADIRGDNKPMSGSNSRVEADGLGNPCHLTTDLPHQPPPAVEVGHGDPRRQRNMMQVTAV